MTKRNLLPKLRITGTGDVHSLAIERGFVKEEDERFSFAKALSNAVIPTVHTGKSIRKTIRQILQ